MSKKTFYDTDFKVRADTQNEIKSKHQIRWQTLGNEKYGTKTPFSATTFQIKQLF